MALKQETITALSEYIERQAAFCQLVVDKLGGDPELGAFANDVSAKAGHATDAVLSETVEQ